MSGSGGDLDQIELSLATYSASVTGLVAAATPTDIFTITGSASKTIRVTKIAINGNQTTGGTVNLQIIKRSTANTAGTSTARAAVPHESTDAAATATVLAYTANPTLGTAIAVMQAKKLYVSAVTATAQDLLLAFSRPQNTKAPTLRGVAEVLAVNLNAVTVTGNSFNISIEWIEE